MHIHCNLCQIRSWQWGDEQTLPYHADNKAIWLNLRDGFPHPYTPADARQWIESVVGASPETTFAISVGGEAIGGIGLAESIKKLGVMLLFSYFGESF